MKYTRQAATAGVLSLLPVALIPAPAAALAPCVQTPAPVTSGITVTVTCSTAQIDQRHRVIVTVKHTDASGATQTITVTQNVPAQATVADVAGGLADKIAAEKGAAAVVTTPSALVRNVTLPDGCVVESIKTEKLVGKMWQERTGHLKVVSTQQLNSSGSGGSGLVATVPSFTQLRFTIDDASCDPIVVELVVRGVLPSGLSRKITYNPTYPESTTIHAVLADIAEFLTTTFHMYTEFVDDHTLLAYPDPVLVGVPFVSFGVYSDNDHPEITHDDDDIPGWTSRCGVTALP